MLDSDTANADEKLYVEFYMNERKPYVGVPFVKIMVPGDKTNVIDQPVKDSHKERFPRQWLYFQMKNDGGQMVGTPLKQWADDRPDDINPNQLAELIILKFQTVEQVALMTDAQAQKTGMGAIGLREKAKAYLSSRNKNASSSELDATKAALAETNARMEAMQAQMAELIAAQSKSKGGRPRKEAAEA